MSWSRLNSALLGLLILGGVSQATAGEMTPPRQTELGVLLEQDCGSCHGLTRRGGLGSPLMPESLEHFTDEALIGIILDGVPGTPMPPWRPFLTREEAAWLVARLRKGLKQ